VATLDKFPAEFSLIAVSPLLVLIAPVEP